MKMIFLPAAFLCGCILAPCFGADDGHPRLLASADDREAILAKIESAPWMESSLETMQAEVEPYADRHAEDPEWLLSRMLMHWGQHYTHFPILQGTARYNTRLDMEARSGDAPVPTVRVSFGSVEPLMSDGSFGKTPEIADYPTYHAEDLFRVESPKTPGLWEEVHLGNKVHWWNRRISDLGAKSATLYYLTGDQKYAALAADVFMQWALGVYYQDAYNFPPTQEVYAGYFGGQDLSDYNYKTMAVSYDYTFDYLVAHQDRYLGDLQNEGHLEGETIRSIADTVFTKFLQQGTFRSGLVHDLNSPNNHTMKQSELIWFALSIDDPVRREACMNVFLHENPQMRQPGGVWEDLWMGQCPWDIFFTNAIEAETGLWKEPSGYHQFPVRAAVRAAAAMEVNGYTPWTDYPALLKATYAQFRFSFPDSTIVQFGDSSPAMYPDAVSLEFAHAAARREDLPEADLLAAYLGGMIDKGQYVRAADYKQLVYFEPELGPRAALGDVYPRTDAIPFADLYLQRVRGDDPENGLMLQVNGGRFVHDQRKGIDMEIYGPGRVLGSHSGTQYPFMRKEMAEFYVRSGAANTVVPGAQDLVLGDPMQLVAMEPMPGEEAVAPLFSFSEVAFSYNGTAQQRTNALIAMEGGGGFYLDIFRSDHPVSNDYLYHNIGPKVVLTDGSGSPLRSTRTTYFSEPAPGYQYYTDKRASLSRYDVIASFAGIDLKGAPVLMRAHIPWHTRRIYATARSPYNFRAPSQQVKLAETDRSTLAIRQDGSAWNEPFVVVFDPSRPGQHKVRAVERTGINGGETQVVEVRAGDKRYIIFSSLNAELPVTHKDMVFRGRFGIVCRELETDVPVSLYLGYGSEISAGESALVAEEGQTGAYLEL